MLCLINGQTSFVNSVKTYITSALENDEATFALAEAIFAAQESFFEYYMGRGEVTNEQFMSDMETVMALYEALEDKTNYDKYLSVLYSAYVGIYDGILNPPENPDIQPETPEVEPENPDVELENPDVELGNPDVEAA